MDKRVRQHHKNALVCCMKPFAPVNTLRNNHKHNSHHLPIQKHIHKQKISNLEAQRLGFLPHSLMWRYETLRVRGRVQGRYRDVRTGRFIRRHWIL